MSQNRDQQHENNHHNDQNNTNQYIETINSYKSSIDEFIKKYGHIDYQADHSDTGTQLRAYCDKINTIPVEVFEYLIDKGARVNAPHLMNRIPIIAAISNFNSTQGGDLRILELLLQHVPGVVRSNWDKNDIECDEFYHIDQYDDFSSYLHNSLLEAACCNQDNIPLSFFKKLIQSTAGNLLRPNLMGSVTPLHLSLQLFGPQSDYNILGYFLSLIRGDNNNNNNNNDNNGRDYGKKLKHKHTLQSFQEDLTYLNSACKNIHYIPLSIFHRLVELYGSKIYTILYFRQSRFNQITFLHEVCKNIKSTYSPGSSYLLSLYGITIGDMNDVEFMKFDTLESTMKIVDNGFINNANDAKKYLLWLCYSYEPNYEAIRYLVEHFRVGIFHQNESNHQQNNNLSPLPPFVGSYLTAINSKKFLSRSIEPLQEDGRVDHQGSLVMDYLIEKFVSEL
jgi:hypothetical protein